VRYGNSDSAQRAIDMFDGKQLEGTDRPLSIRIAKTPRASLGRESPSPKTPPRVNAKSSACYVSGFDVSLSEKVLRSVFAPWGSDAVKSVRIIRRQNAPYAFINFYRCEVAAAAAKALNNTKFGNCMLTVRLQL